MRSRQTGNRFASSDALLSSLADAVVDAIADCLHSLLGATSDPRLLTLAANLLPLYGHPQRRYALFQFLSGLLERSPFKRSAVRRLFGDASRDRHL